MNVFKFIGKNLDRADQLMDHTTGSLINLAATAEEATKVVRLRTSIEGKAEIADLEKQLANMSRKKSTSKAK